MNNNPFDFMRSALQGDLVFGTDETSDDELAQNESRANNETDRLSIEPFDQIAPISNVNTLHDLELWMRNGCHTSLREGTTIHYSSPHIGSAVLFEASKVKSTSSGAVHIRYLPLVNTGAKTSSQPGSGAVPTPQALLLQAVRNPTNGPIRPPPSTVQAQTPTISLAKDRPLDIAPDAKCYIDRARAQRSLVEAADPNATSKSTGQWPSDAIPVELFETITQTLSHRDIRNMRLVCKEFESKTSGALFKEVIVPFTAELYDMIEDDVSTRLSNKSKSGSIRRNAADAPLPKMPELHVGNGDSICYRKTSDTTARQGLRVFEGFGPHMNKFGIRFEVTEADLSMAPAKASSTKHVEAYHGGYEWPPPGYARFGRLASLEQIADETPRMTAALSKLVNVREIGLCLDSGLGFLGGPDRSHHDMIIERPATMLEEAHSRPAPDNVEDLWSGLRQSHSSFTSGVQLSQERLVSCIVTSDRNEPAQLPTVASATGYDDPTLWPSFETDGIFSGIDLSTPLHGVFYTTSADLGSSSNSTRESQPPLSPANLTSEQNQWILETGWAQSAFLDTYILALGDNPQIFHQVTKVTISKLSSGLLSKLDRDAFWTALPNVKDVTLLVSPDWRIVCKDEAGCAVTHSTAPSLAVNTFLAVIRRVSLLDVIERLRIGWTQGGENAKGMFGRNNNLMPAPIATLGQLLKPAPDVLSFDHLEDVTLVNCWISPQALLKLTSTQTVAAVMGKTLKLESVSLTASTQLELQDFLQVNVGTMQQFRQGCWPWIIHHLRGRVQPFVQAPDYTGSAQSETQAPYNNITFNSCGYVVLPNLVGFDQSAIELGPTMLPAHFDIDRTIHTTEWFRLRADQLRPHMQSTATKDDYLGRIVPWINHREIAVLNAWQIPVGLHTDPDAEYDGFPMRGTGRFWGKIQAREAADYDSKDDL